MNESLIGFRHEETLGIITGCGLKVTKEGKLQKIITARFHSSYIIVSRMWVEKIGRFRLLKRTAAG